MEITFKQSGSINISNLKVKWKGKIKLPNEMKKVNDIWTLDLFIPKCKHFYQFLVNDQICLNDPMADLYYLDNDGILWSVMETDEKGNRLYYDTEYAVNIENYTISNRILNYKHPYNPRTKIFNFLLDSIVSVRFDFNNIIGIHAVTLIWYDPTGNVFDHTENKIFTTDDIENPVISLYFNLDLQNSNFTYPHGTWKFELFVDGGYIMADYFQLSQSKIYTNNAQINISL